MKRALFLAEKDGRYASPNPRVGAVLVKNGRVVGEGAHQQYGGPHAEVVALQKAGPKAKGAVLYVTLEPCGHYGKTPPCVDAVIRAGVKKVVAAMQDPFPLIRGKSFQKLRKAGIKVQVGVLEEQARRLNENFIFSLSEKRPKVLLKAGISLDGKIAAVSGKSKWITGEAARKWAHLLRAQSDAILVGSRTALMDDPSLSVRLPGFGRKDGRPFRVVLDSTLRIKPRAKIFQGPQKTLVFTSPRSSPSKQRTLEKQGAVVFRVPYRRKMLSLRAILRILHSFNVRTLMVEGGGEIHASFLREKLADELALFVAPKILGGKALSWVGGKGVGNPNMAPLLKDMSVEKVGEDFLIRGKF